jgi:hypothetical protein
MRDQISHPYKTTGKIIVLYILIYLRPTTWLKSEDGRKEGSLVWIHFNKAMSLDTAVCIIFTVTKHVSVTVHCVNLYVSSMIDESINEVRHEAVLEHFNKL